MKHILIILFFITYLSSSEIYSQSEDRNRIFECAQIFGDSITFLNDFEVNQPKRKVSDDPNGASFQIYLMKGTEYRFALCCLSLSNKVMKLYNDSITEKNPIRSTYTNRRNKRYFDFICRKSGIYNISIRFKKDNVMGEEFSTLGILGFIRKVH